MLQTGMTTDGQTDRQLTESRAEMCCVSRVDGQPRSNQWETPPARVGLQQLVSVLPVPMAWNSLQASRLAHSCWVVHNDASLQRLDKLRWKLSRTGLARCKSISEKGLAETDRVHRPEFAALSAIRCAETETETA
ncbi:hypothetical protein J6590_047110 [Homalodisca vitripennis]|nr:hypothetical protein J6590_047110 [Homalodisca vitripennis]